jgi:hypothetical protein
MDKYYPNKDYQREKDDPPTTKSNGCKAWYHKVDGKINPIGDFLQKQLDKDWKRRTPAEKKIYLDFKKRMGTVEAKYYHSCICRKGD